MSNANNVPQIHPARKDSAVQEKTKLVASTEEKIEEKPAEMSQARPNPISEPRPLAAKAKAAPSYRNNARASLRRRPSARTVATSPRRTSARSMMMVSDNNTPAAMVKVPKTRNMAERAPDDASACSAASNFTATMLR